MDAEGTVHNAIDASSKQPPYIRNKVSLLITRSLKTVCDQPAESAQESATYQSKIRE
jgi:hypothetical protein